MPGASRGTRICDWRACFGASGSVTHMTMRILQRGSPMPEDHHFSPFRTHSSPSRRASSWMLVASEEPT